MPLSDMKKSVLLILFFIPFAGCTRDYTFSGDVTPQIVVNSIINPDSTLKVDLWWSKKIDGNKEFSRVEKARVVVKENGTLLFDVASEDEELAWDYYPKEGAAYSITIDLDGYDRVSAATTVPPRPTIACRYEAAYDVDGYGLFYHHYTIDRITVPEDAAIHIAAYSTFAPKYLDLTLFDKYAHYDDIYSSSPFLDPFNMSSMPNDAAYSGSTNCYNPFARIPGDNLDHVFPFYFSAQYDYGYNKMVYPEDYWENQEKYKDDLDPLLNVYQDQYIIAINASPEYDLYRTSLINYNSFNTGHNPLLEQFYTIYSNIDNGIGIFASYSQAAVRFEFND